MVSEQARRVAAKNSEIDNAVQDILMRNLGLTWKEGDDPKAKPDVALMAWGTMGVRVGIALANIFFAINRPNEHRTYRAICDLTFGLNTNDFWQKNAAVLLPVIHTALNSFRDGVALTVERQERGEYSSNDALISAAKAAPLELFPLLAYLIGGQELMLTASIPLKTELAPYFLG